MCDLAEVPEFAGPDLSEVYQLANNLFILTAYQYSQNLGRSQ